MVYDAAYSDSENLEKKSISDKILKDRAYKIARSCGYNGNQRALASMFFFFYKKIGSGLNANEQLAEELHKPVLKILKRKNVYANLKSLSG